MDWWPEARVGWFGPNVGPALPDGIGRVFTTGDLRFTRVAVGGEPRPGAGTAGRRRGEDADFAGWGGNMQLFDCMRIIYHLLIFYASIK